MTGILNYDVKTTTKILLQKPVQPATIIPYWIMRVKFIEKNGDYMTGNLNMLDITKNSKNAIINVKNTPSDSSGHNHVFFKELCR